MELFKRLGDNWNPQKVLDICSGPGVGALAFKQALVDRIGSLQWEASEIGFPKGDENIVHPVPVDVEVCSTSNVFERITKLMHQATAQNTYPFSKTTLETRFSNDFKGRGSRDLVICNRQLSSIEQTQKRDGLVREIYNLVNDDGGVLVLIEPGTQFGFASIARARELLLRMSDGDGRIVSPCSHEKPCPLAQSPGTIRINRLHWCHFYQRVEMPKYQPFGNKKYIVRDADAPYSFLVFQKGRKRQEFDENNKIETADLAPNEFVDSAYNWPRIIAPPNKRKGHIVFSTCSPNGSHERMVVPKSQGSGPFHDARKAHWGDLWPLGSKTKVVEIKSSEGAELASRPKNRDKEKSGRRKIQTIKDTQIGGESDSWAYL